MIYCFIDTNIFIRIITQGRPGCEDEQFDALRTLVADELICLLLPEVVLLEIEKHFAALPKQIESNCDKVLDSVTKATQDAWNEIDSLKSQINERIKAFKGESVERCKKLTPDILNFLTSSPVELIPLTSDVLVQATRRRIAERMPNCRNSNDQDAMIVESLVSRLGGIAERPTFLFCSENTSDFALSVPIQGGLDKRFVLDPKIQESLPKAHYSVNLAEMLSIARGSESLPEPTNDEIENAIMIRDIHDMDEDEDIYFSLHGTVMQAIQKEAKRQFTEDVLPSLPEDVRQIRKELSDTAFRALRECRACETWTERSEYKLPQWIEYVEETMIPYTSLPKLVRIKNNLLDYLRIHQQSDRQNEET